MNPNAGSKGFVVALLAAVAEGKTAEQFADDMLKRRHVERHGWIPLGRDARDGVDKWTTLERGLQNPATLDEAAQLSGYRP